MHAALGVLSQTLKKVLDVFGARAKVRKLIHRAIG
jgi:hypothetical protein